DGGAWGANTPENMAGPLGAFFRKGANQLASSPRVNDKGSLESDQKDESHFSRDQGEEKRQPDFTNFPCPSCGKKLKAAASASGKRTKCPKCGQAMVIPQPAGDNEAPKREVQRVTETRKPAGIEERTCRSCGKAVLGKQEPTTCPHCGRVNPGWDQVEQT